MEGQGSCGVQRWGGWRGIGAESAQFLDQVPLPCTPAFFLSHAQPSPSRGHHPFPTPSV